MAASTVRFTRCCWDSSFRERRGGGIWKWELITGTRKKTLYQYTYADKKALYVSQECLQADEYLGPVPVFIKQGCPILSRECWGMGNPVKQKLQQIPHDYLISQSQLLVD